MYKEKINLGSRTFLINDGQGMGGAGMPDDHYLRNWIVAQGTNRGNGYQGYMSIDYALTADYISDSAKTKIRKKLGL